MVFGEMLLHNTVSLSFQSWLPTVKDNVLPHFPFAGKLGGLPPDPDGVKTAAGKWNKILDDTILPTVSRVVSAEFAAALQAGAVKYVPGTKRVITPKSIPFFDSALQWRYEYLAAQRNWLVGVPELVRRKIATEIATGVSKNESLKELRDRIAPLVEPDTKAWSRQTQVLARTLAVDALNGSTVAAALEEQRITGVKLDKLWVTVGDQRVRDSHRKADDDRVPVNGFFQVGAASLRWPGDTLSPVLDETRGCRCSVAVLRNGQQPDGEREELRNKLLDQWVEEGLVR